MGNGEGYIAVYLTWLLWTIIIIGGLIIVLGVIELVAETRSGKRFIEEAERFLDGK